MNEYLRNSLDRIEMVNTLECFHNIQSEPSRFYRTDHEAYRVQTNFIHHRDPSLLAFLVQLIHCRRRIGSGDDVGLGANGRLDDEDMEGVRDQRDDQVDMLKRLVQSSSIIHIKGNCAGILETMGQLLGASQSPASCTIYQLVGSLNQKGNRT